MTDPTNTDIPSLLTGDADAICADGICEIPPPAVPSKGC